MDPLVFFYKSFSSSQPFFMDDARAIFGVRWGVCTRTASALRRQTL